MKFSSLVALSLMSGIAISHAERHLASNTVNPPDICGQSMVMDIKVSGCKKQCNRKFKIYFPQVVCHGIPTTQGSPGIKELLPVVVTLHGLGGSMEFFALWRDLAAENNFVWINPEGYEQSWNGETCCGTALSEKIDDVGFLKDLLKQMSEKFPFFTPDVAYAIGYSNGGYMALHAASLFRAVAPMAGYQVKTLKTDHPVGVFLHHSDNDPDVQITGCCKDPSTPQCCCGLGNAFDVCTSAQIFTKEWGIEFNGCSKDRKHFSLERKDIKCLTYDACTSNVNTTYCIHVGKKHFEDDTERLEIFELISDYFAREACKIYGESWDESTFTCKCPSGLKGKYCMVDESQPVVYMNPYVPKPPPLPVGTAGGTSGGSGSGHSSGHNSKGQTTKATNNSSGNSGGGGGGSPIGMIVGIFAVVGVLSGGYYYWHQKRIHKFAAASQQEPTGLSEGNVFDSVGAGTETGTELTATGTEHHEIM